MPPQTQSTTDVPTLSPTASVWFDGLRLAAAQAVVLGHSFDFFGWFSSMHDPDHIQIQRLAVSVFFLLSGFLIPYSVTIKSTQTKVLAVEMPYTFGSYLFDRSTRIYAALVPALVFIAVVDALPFSTFASDYPGAPGSHSLLTWFGNLLHLQEFPRLFETSPSVPIFGTGDPLWSLAVEWWIYMLYGALVLRTKSVLRLGLVLLGTFSVLHNLKGGTGDGIVLVWGLGWAVFVAWKRFAGLRFLRSVKSRVLLAVMALALFGLASVSAGIASHRSHFGLDLPFAGLSAVALLSLLLALPEIRRAQDTDLTPKRIRTFVRWGAGYSYTLYLTHFTVLTVLYELRDQAQPWVLVIIAIVASNAAAWLVSLLGERHTFRLRQFLNGRLLNSLMPHKAA